MGLSVVFVLWSGHIGGAERQTAALARALQARGLRVRVLVIEAAEPLASIAQGLDLVALGFERGRDALGRRAEVRRSIADFDVCILPSNGFLTDVCSGAGPVLVAMEHGDALNAAALLGPARRLSDRVARRYAADKLALEIAVSDSAKEGLLKLPHASRVEVIHNGIDTEPLLVAANQAVGGDQVVVGTLGRMVAGKGFEGFIDAAARVSSVRDDVCWRIAGDGPLRKPLEGRAANRDLGERLVFEGWVTDVPSFWAGCDVGVFVNDSLTESFGLAAMEALGCGAALVVTDDASARELLGEAAGVRFVPSGESQALATALDALVSAGHQRVGVRLSRHTWVADTYGIDRCAETYHALIASLVGRGAGLRAGSEEACKD